MFGMFNQNFVSIRFNLFKGITRTKLLKALNQICDETGIKIVRTKYFVMKKNPEAQDTVQGEFKSNDGISNEDITSSIMRIVESDFKFKNYKCVTIDVDLEKDLLDKNNEPISVIKIEESKKINNNNMKIIYYSGSMFTQLTKTSLKSKEDRILDSVTINYKKDTSYFDAIRNISIAMKSSTIESFSKDKVSHKYIIKGLEETILKHNLVLKKINSIEIAQDKEFEIKESNYKDYDINNIEELARFIEEFIEKHKDIECRSVILQTEIEDPIFDYEGSPIFMILADLKNYSKDKSDEKMIKSKVVYGTAFDNTGEYYYTEIEPIVEITIGSEVGLPVELLELILTDLTLQGLKIDELRDATFFEIIPPIGDEKIEPIEAMVLFNEKLSPKEIARKIKSGMFANMYVSKNLLKLSIKPKEAFLDKYSNTISNIVIKVDDDLNVDIDLYYGYSNQKPTLLK